MLLAIYFVTCMVACGEVPSNHEGLGRDLVDPCLQTHWKLVNDSVHPAWPGRLSTVAMKSDRSLSGLAVESGSTDAPRSNPPVVIRAGERISVEQIAPILRGHFVAMALGSARQGELLRVRLSIGKDSKQNLGGQVITVLATGPEQASWRPVGLGQR